MEQSEKSTVHAIWEKLGRSLKYFRADRLTAAANIALCVANTFLIYFIYLQVDIQRTAERPFIGITGLGSFIHLDKAGAVEGISLLPQVRNQGNSPPTASYFVTNYYWGEKAIQQDFDYPDFPPYLVNKTIVMPKLDAYGGERYFEKQFMDKVNSGSENLYVYGEIDYIDYFSSDRLHFSMFCFHVLSLANPVTAVTCERHNCFENTCRKEARSKVIEKSIIEDN